MPWPDTVSIVPRRPVLLAAAGEALEKHLRVGDAPPGTVVAHGQQRRPVAPVDVKHDPRRARRVAQRVVDHPLDDLAQPFGVAVDDDVRAGPVLDDDRDVPALGGTLEAVDGAGADGLEADGLK